MTLTDVLLLGGAGFLAWKIWGSGEDTPAADVGYDEAEQGRSVYWPLVTSAANAAGIPPWALAAIVNTESSWSNAPTTKPCPKGSRAGQTASAGCEVPCIASCYPTCAIGLAQLKAKYFAPGGDAKALCDPATNLRIAAGLLAHLYGRFKDWNVAFAAYHDGEGAVQAAIDAGHDPVANIAGYVRKTVSSARDYGAGSALAGLSGLAVAARRPALFRVAA